MTIAPERFRYLRVAPGEGDGYFSIAELAAFCRAPTPISAATMHVVEAPMAVGPKPVNETPAVKAPPPASVFGPFERLLAVAILMLVGGGLLAGRGGGRARRTRRRRDHPTRPARFRWSSSCSWSAAARPSSTRSSGSRCCSWCSARRPSRSACCSGPSWAGCASAAWGSPGSFPRAATRCASTRCSSWPSASRGS